MKRFAPPSLYFSRPWRTVSFQWLLFGRMFSFYFSRGFGPASSIATELGYGRHILAWRGGHFLPMGWPFE